MRGQEDTSGAWVDEKEAVMHGMVHGVHGVRGRYLFVRKKRLLGMGKRRYWSTYDYQ